MERLSGYAVVLLVAALVSVWLSGCDRQTDSSQSVALPTDGSTNNLSVLTYEELRRQGWRSFDELTPDAQAFFERVLGTELEELKGKKLLIKKSLKPTTTPIRPSPNEVVPDKTSPEGLKIKPRGDYCYEDSHNHCEGIVIRVDCINDGNPFGYARQYHYYRYLAATDGWGALDHKGHILSKWISDIEEYDISYCALYSTCP